NLAPLPPQTPGYVLLVDDDRWYDQEAVYRAALNEAGVPFDEWNTEWRNGDRHSPPLTLLTAYDFVIWYTGYDWFDPIKPEENESLSAYLDQGGRLFLSSQDFLYYHHNTRLARSQLGIIEYQESVTPTPDLRRPSPVPAQFGRTAAADLRQLQKQRRWPHPRPGRGPLCLASIRAWRRE
ncbi:MAG: hypothetical protein M5U34_47830, partial [Chloroflexi bacterium]|nr:hypothetical protein [Chloroflexota bacterium]